MKIRGGIATPGLQGPRQAARPIGEVQRTFEEVRRLPRRQQRKVVEIVSAMLEQCRKAS